ncbi:hypothetical protein OH686_13370 [Pseudomonas sp. SO81]|nr:hypothetical protein OH686_13370 [Pseudomonas sp. SO81]
MITPTSALIVLPLARAPVGATKTNKPRIRRGLLCAGQATRGLEAGQYTGKPRQSRLCRDRLSARICNLTVSGLLGQYWRTDRDRIEGARRVSAPLHQPQMTNG